MAGGTRTLTRAGVERAARVIGVTPREVQAVLQVESLGHGFLADGRPKILFERHHFRRLTGGAFDGTHPHLSAPRGGGYAGGGAEWPRLYEAVQLNADAAVQAASWGIAQVMGFNWRLCGEKSITGFLLAMHHNEDAQLALMAQFIVARGIDKPLRALDFDEVARLYNGPRYAEGGYHHKLRAAWEALA